MDALVFTPALSSAIMQCQVSYLVAADLWAWAECSNCLADRELELRLLAASYPGAKLGDLLPRLRCSSCGAQPSRVAALDVRGRQIELVDAGGDDGLARGRHLPDAQAAWVIRHPESRADAR